MAESESGDASSLNKAGTITQMLDHSAMERPLYQPDFVKTKAFQKADQKMSQSHISALVFSGSTGNGKTTMARELCANAWPHDMDQNKVEAIFREFNCTSLDSFYRDLSSLYDNLKIRQAKLQSDKDWKVIEAMFHDLNTAFPDFKKIIIFDDAEAVEPVLDILNHLCKVIDRNAEIKGHWKFLLTSQKHAKYNRQYDGIGADNFIDVTGFEMDDIMELFRSTELDRVVIKDIVEVVGNRPLTLKICLSSILSNQVDELSDSVGNLLHDIKIQAEALKKSKNRMDSALVAIKISIQRLVDELPNKQVSREVIKTLTMFHEKHLTVELLVACAETYTDLPEQAKEIVKNLVGRFIERGLCTKKREGKVNLFSLHQLVKEAFTLFVTDDKLLLLEKALLAITRVMPQDGRRHQTHIVSFYGDHGNNLDSVIKSMKPRINAEETPYILWLHTIMLIGMGYCQLAQRTDDYSQGIAKLKEARNKYCELVSNNTYEALRRNSQTAGDSLEIEKSIVRRLYVDSQNLPFTNSQAYRQYIADLPLHRRLTKKDLANMMPDPSSFELTNEHLTRDQWDILVRDGKVLDDDVLGKVYIAELLAGIYSVWSMVPRRKAGYEGEIVEDCLVQAGAAMEVYEKIYQQHKVYLLPYLITEREMLVAKLKTANTRRQVNEIRGQLEVLSNVGNNPQKRMAYEAGLLRSDMSKDSYHKLLCLQSAINCQGRLYEFVNDEDNYDRGNRMFTDVQELAGQQVYRHSALCYSYKNFAHFLYSCKKYRQAVLCLLTAMLELHKSLLNGNGSGKARPQIPYPEFTHPRFRELYSNLVPFYEKFHQEREKVVEARDDLEMRSDERLLSVNMAECEYLRKAISYLKDNFSDDRDVGTGILQPEESNNSFQYLENIVEEEIQDLPMAVTNVAVPE